MLAQRRDAGQANITEIFCRALGKQVYIIVADAGVCGNVQVWINFIEAIELIDEIGEGHQDKSMHEDTLHLVLLAMGDALLGEPLAKSLGLPRRTARDIAVRQLKASPRLSTRLES